MKFTVITLLPELIEASLTVGVVGRACEAGTITVDTINPREFTHDRHHTVDDTPYGGGPGMVMKAEPLLASLAKACAPRVPAMAAGPEMEAAGPAPAAGPEIDAGIDSPEPAWPSADDITKVERALPGAAALAKVETSLTSVENAIEKIETAIADGTRANVDTSGGGSTGGAGGATSSTSSNRDGSNAAANANAGTSPDAAGTRTSDTSAAGTRTSDTSAAGTRPSDTSAAGTRTSDTSAAGTRTSDTSAAGTRPHRIFLSPSGTPLTQARVRELGKLEHLVLLCGRYEGVDQRVIDSAIDEEISIGDYVLSGGELGALVVIDAVARLVPGVLGAAESADDESFSAGLLEYPQYTRPAELDVAVDPPRAFDRGVPAVLKSGNHATIAAWRRAQAMARTGARRPDLWKHVRQTKADEKLYAPLKRRTHLALVHYPIVDRIGTVITGALTNFDIHDLARSTTTYGLAGYYIVTPITSQREKAEHIAKLWMEAEQGDHRAQALSRVHPVESIEAAIADLEASYGRVPIVVATSAKADSFPGVSRRSSSELLAEASLDPAPLLILLGTGWGLAEALIPSVSRVLAPIEGDSAWNHLSVRSAGAVILDRLFGRPA